MWKIAVSGRGVRSVNDKVDVSMSKGLRGKVLKGVVGGRLDVLASMVDLDLQDLLS